DFILCIHEGSAGINQFQLIIHTPVHQKTTSLHLPNTTVVQQQQQQQQRRHRKCTRYFVYF
ncbi:MAG: hypothetical protein ACI9CQ_002050, partial [Saprospiraceae bacterium]